MKTFKALLLTCSLILMVGVANAQYQQGQLDFNLGLGLGNTFGAAGSATFPPINLSGDYGVTDNISVGGLIGYTAYKEDFSFFGGSGSWTYTYLIIGARGAYHFDVSEDFDLYAGAMLGYNVASVNYEGTALFGVTEPSVGGVAIGIFGGARYHFSENLGAFAELGYSVGYLNLGATYRIR